MHKICQLWIVFSKREEISSYKNIYPLIPIAAWIRWGKEYIQCNDIPHPCENPLTITLPFFPCNNLLYSSIIGLKTLKLLQDLLFKTVMNLIRVKGLVEWYGETFFWSKFDVEPRKSLILTYSDESFRGLREYDFDIFDMLA